MWYDQIALNAGKNNIWHCNVYSFVEKSWSCGDFIEYHQRSIVEKLINEVINHKQLKIKATFVYNECNHGVRYIERCSIAGSSIKHPSEIAPVCQCPQAI